MVSGEGDGGGTGGKESNLASSRERYGDTARASATEAPERTARPRPPAGNLRRGARDRPPGPGNRAGLWS